MRLVWVTLVGIVLLTSVSAQGGQGGLGAGNQGGQRQREYDRTAEAIDVRIREYLDGDEIKNILTPGEFSEWPLNLKAGQVVVAEAKSDAFDPALEIVQTNENDPAPEKAKALATNDDRYPGDQRPLLIWRCEKDGEYSVRGRCFRDKAGGQFFVRFRIYDSMDLLDGEFHEQVVENDGWILLRVPMKAGQIKEFLFDTQRQHRNATIGSVISPIGLPDANILDAARSALPNTFMASVDGDYYVRVFAAGEKNQKLRCKARIHNPIEIANKPPQDSAGIPGSPTIWSVKLKAGQLARFTLTDRGLDSAAAIFEAPDVTKYDLKKPESNPFFPKVPTAEENAKGPALLSLPARRRDSRVNVSLIKRDVTLWIAYPGDRGSDKPYALKLEAADRPLETGPSVSSDLRIGDSDYWSFDAKVGDVMTITSKASMFSAVTNLYDPLGGMVWEQAADPDVVSLSNTLIVTKPGKYLMGMAAYGFGGSGKYEITRKVFSSENLSLSEPAKGELANEQVQVWRLTVKPDEPLLMKWKSTNWNYSVSVYEDNGSYHQIPLDQIDPNTRYGILHVDKPRTYLIVLIGRGDAAKYSINVSPLPGYGGRS
ncbi:MAG: hypothetical protein ABL949_14375 [Fimbriimonadaceae bacterium]